MDKEQKKEFKWNIIKFIIWCILLWMCRWYLQNHPAERISVFSGFEVLWQKVEVIRNNRFGANGDLLESKYSMEKYYKELINIAENNPCLTTDELTDLENTYQNLQNENKNTLNETLPEYTKQAYIFEAMVQDKSCNE